jgi:CheY-like chemotaxis protein
MDGWAVLSALKGDPALRDIPVIMVTILNERGMALSLGTAGFITKPVDASQLNGLLHRLCLGETGASVLIIDDDADPREMMRRLLERSGLKVDEAGNGAEGLSWLETHPRPSLILLDLMMPVMDGFEFLDRMLQNEALKDIPVVVVTAKQLTDGEIESLRVLAQSVIAKGSKSNVELRAAIRDILARRSRQDTVGEPHRGG